MINNEKAYSYLAQTLTSKGYIGIKMLIIRKRKCQARAIRLRKIHLKNLIVKSFSALLFNSQSCQRVKNLNKMADFFMRRRILNRWIKEKNWRENARECAIDIQG